MTASRRGTVCWHAGRTPRCTASGSDTGRSTRSAERESANDRLRAKASQCFGCAAYWDLNVDIWRATGEVGDAKGEKYFLPVLA
jgi:hypothetical protein